MRLIWTDFHSFILRKLQILLKENFLLIDCNLYFTVDTNLRK